VVTYTALLLLLPCVVVGLVFDWRLTEILVQVMLVALAGTAILKTIAVHEGWYLEHLSDWGSTAIASSQASVRRHRQRKVRMPAKDGQASRGDRRSQDRRPRAGPTACAGQVGSRPVANRPRPWENNVPSRRLRQVHKRKLKLKLKLCKCPARGTLAGTLHGAVRLAKAQATWLWSRLATPKWLPTEKQAIDDQCVVSPGSGCTSSSSATFFSRATPLRTWFAGNTSSASPRPYATSEFRMALLGPIGTVTDHGRSADRQRETGAGEAGPGSPRETVSTSPIGA
jgi:hypothetical protein